MSQSPRPADPYSRLSTRCGLTMSQTHRDRRQNIRHQLKIPLVFCPTNTPLTCGHSAESSNLSSGGVYFMTRHPVFVGLPVQVLLRMPRRVSGQSSSERVFDGRVSHVEKGDSPRGISGVGVEFFYWEAGKIGCGNQPQ